MRSAKQGFKSTQVASLGRFCWVLMCALSLLVFSAFAYSPPDKQQIDAEVTRLSGETPINEPLLAQYQQLQSQLDAIARLQAQRDENQAFLSEFSQRRAQLQSNIDDVASLDLFQTKSLKSYGELSQALARLNAAQNEWRVRDQQLSEQLASIEQSRLQLPSRLAQLDQEIQQQSIAVSDQGGELSQWLQVSKVEVFKLDKEVLSSELQSLEQRSELAKLEQRLLSQQFELATPIIAELQARLTKVEQASAKELIDEAANLKASDSDDALISQINNDGAELTRVLNGIENARRTVQELDAERTVLESELRLVRENLIWLKDSTAFGASIRAQLYRLPNKIDTKSTADQIANAHIRRYEIEQSIESTKARGAEQAQDNQGAQSVVSDLQLRMLSQLSQEYEKLISDLSKLQLSKSQYALEVESARAYLREQQLWTRSNVPLWENLTRLDSQTWFGVSSLFAGLSDNFNFRQLLRFFSLLIVLSVLLWFVRQRLDKFAALRREQYQKVYGHPLKDKFSNTLSLLCLNVLRATFIPLWFILAGYLCYRFWPSQTEAEVYALIMSSAVLLFFIELFYASSHPQGLLALHLNWPKHFCAFLYKQAARIRWPSLMLLLLFFVLESIAGSLEAELTRVGFLLIMLGMTAVYYVLLKKDAIPATLPSPFNQGSALAFLRITVLGSFVGIIVMAIMGLYIAAWILLMYQQLTIYVVLGALLIYQLAERWLKLEHRQLSYQRLQARRDELIAQQKEQAQAPPELNELREASPEVSEQGLESEKISEQSLTLLRGLSLIGLMIALLTLWSAAFEMTSWFNKVVLWQVNQVREGATVQIDVTLRSLIVAVITLIATVVGIRNLPGILELLLLRRLTLSPGMGYALTTLLRYVIFMCGVLLAFSSLGFQWSQLQWLVAAFGVGLGFGLQEIFANFISGLILLFERPIRIGDIVTIDDLSGTVSKIETRATTIIDWDNKEIVVPNKTFITEKLINWSLSDSVTRIVIPIGVAYGSDVDLVENLLNKIANEHPLILDDPAPSVFFLAFGASSLDFEMRVHIPNIDHRLSSIHIINRNIDRLFKEHGIEIAFPQMDIHVRDMPKTDSAGD